MNTPLTDIGKKVQTFRAGTNVVDLSLHAAGEQSAVRCGQRHKLRSGRCQLRWVSFSPATRTCPDALTNTYYKGFAPRIGLAWSPELERWNPRQARRRPWQDERQRRLRHLLQSDRAARARTVQRRTSVRRQQLHLEPAASDTVPRSERRRLPESVHRHSQSAARASCRLVAVPPDDVLR